MMNLLQNPLKLSVEQRTDKINCWQYQLSDGHGSVTILYWAKRRQWTRGHWTNADGTVWLRKSYVRGFIQCYKLQRWAV